MTEAITGAGDRDDLAVGLDLEVNVEIMGHAGYFIGGMTQKERQSSRFLVYQCLPSRYGFNPDDLRQADARPSP